MRSIRLWPSVSPSPGAAVRAIQRELRKMRSTLPCWIRMSCLNRNAVTNVMCYLVRNKVCSILFR